MIQNPTRPANPATETAITPGVKNDMNPLLWLLDDFSSCTRLESIPIGVGGTGALTLTELTGEGGSPALGGDGPDTGFSAVTAWDRRGSHKASVSDTFTSWTAPLNLYST